MKKTHTRLRWISSLAVLSLLVIAWLTAAFVLQNSLRAAVHKEELRNTGQARAFAEYSSSAIKRIDEFMLDTRDLYDDKSARVSAQVQRRQASISDLVFQFELLDKDGRLALSQQGQAEQYLDLRHKETFQAHQQAALADQLFISTPVKDKESGLWSIQLSRPMFKQGLFDGVVVVSIRSDLLAAFNARIGGDVNRSVSIINTDGVILVRYPQEVTATAFGKVVKDLPFLALNAPISGAYQDIGTGVKQDRLLGYYRQPEYALNFVIGVSMATVMAPYYQSRQIIIGVTTVISLLLLVFWRMAFIAFAKIMKSQHELELVRDRANLASSAKSEFLANISHEIRTPMNAILGMLHLLHKTKLTTCQSAYAQKTEKAARALLRLVDDILNISKIEARKLELDPKPFELQRMLDGIALVLSANLNGTTLALRFAVEPNVPPVLYGDDMRLEQVLINLAGNAIKFSQDGEILIRVQLIERGTDDALLKFSVRDKGIGIAPENQTHIFDSFTQADASNTRSYDGSGLGLSISSRIVALLGGELKLDSALGSGSRFYFQIRLPIAEMPISANEKPPSLPAHLPAGLPASLVNAKPPGRLAGLRLLLVEDNEINQLIARGLLSLEGADITLAGNGQLGLDAIASQAPFDAVLMDLQMPVMDGYAATRAIRQALGLSALPIIAMTANTLPTERKTCLEAGMNDHIGKPFMPSDLVATVERWTKSKQFNDGAVEAKI
jgi:signal transduction histidine kinase